METKPTDAKLVEVYLAGRDKAFEKLYKRYERPLFSFILKFVNDRKSAEDLFQQTWMKVINGLPKYEEKGKFSSWLFGIANNCCIDHVRKVSRARVDESASAEGVDRLPGGDGNPERDLMKREQQEWLKKAIAKLPEEQRQVVLLRLHGEMPFKEIARTLDSPLNTVLGRMHYAVQNLRKMMEEEFREGSQDALSRI